MGGKPRKKPVVRKPKRSNKLTAPPNLDLPRDRGRVFEWLYVEEWVEELKKEGYEDFHSNRTRQGRSPKGTTIFASSGSAKGSKGWLKKTFPGGRPDFVAIDHKNKRILVGDVTAGPWSRADIQSGDVRKLPNEVGTYQETRPHLAKTIDYGEQLARNLPDDMKDYDVVVQDRYREADVKKSKPVVVYRNGRFTRPSSTHLNKLADPTGSGEKRGEALRAKNQRLTGDKLTKNKGTRKSPIPKARLVKQEAAGKPSSGKLGAKSAALKTSGVKNTFVISAKHKLFGTIKFVSLKNILKLGAPLAFDMFLGLIGGYVRAKLKEKALAGQFRDLLDDQAVQEKMDAEVKKYPHLENDSETAWYLQLIVVQRWMGIYDEDGDPAISGGEALEEIEFERVEILSNRSSMKCKTVGFKAIPNSPPGWNWRYERCSYPFLINPVYKRKKAHEAFSSAFEECVRLKLLKPAGPTTEQEVESARNACAKELGGIPLPFEPE